MLERRVWALMSRDGPAEHREWHYHGQILAETAEEAVKGKVGMRAMAWHIVGKAELLAVD